MKSVFDPIKQPSVIVADTDDFESIRRYRPRDATTNPSLILKAAQMDEYQHVGDRAPSIARLLQPQVGRNGGVASKAGRNALCEIATQFPEK